MTEIFRGLCIEYLTDGYHLELLTSKYRLKRLRRHKRPYTGKERGSRGPLQFKKTSKGPAFLKNIFHNSFKGS